MRSHGLVHPRFLERLTPQFYPSVGETRQAVVTRNEYGEEVHEWVALSGCDAKPCRVSPRNSREARTAEQVYATATHHIALAGYYPSIGPEMREIVDDIVYDIEGVEFDGQGKTTRLYVRRIVPEKPEPITGS